MAFIVAAPSLPFSILSLKVPLAFIMPAFATAPLNVPALSSVPVFSKPVVTLPAMLVLLSVAKTLPKVAVPPLSFLNSPAFLKCTVSLLKVPLFRIVPPTPFVAVVPLIFIVPPLSFVKVVVLVVSVFLLLKTPLNVATPPLLFVKLLP